MVKRGAKKDELERVRAALAQLHASGKKQTWKERAEIAGCSPRMARKWFACFDEEGYVIKDKPRPGRPRKLSAAQERKVHDVLATKEGATVKDAAKGLKYEVSDRTLYRVAQRDPDLSWGDEVRAEVSDANIVARRNATTEAAIADAVAKLPVTVFADEKIVSFSKKWGVKTRRREKGWRSKANPRKQRLGGWQYKRFYAAIIQTADGRVHRTRLIISKDGAALKAPQLIQQVLKPIHKWSLSVVPAGSVPEHHIDGATIHTAKLTKKWMADNNFICRPHPAQSPDLNRIEKAWAAWSSAMDKCQARKPVSSHNGFKRVAQRCWKNISDATLGRFISELPDVMRAVHANPQKHSSL